MKKLLSLLLLCVLLCPAAMADTLLTMDTTKVPAIPEGTFSAEVISFTGNQTYAVYSAPNKKSIRGAKDRARVSTNGWIQVFGAEGDWILVQYDINKGERNRIGYIYKNALPKDVEVPELKLARAAAVINYDVEVTDDPLVSKARLAKLAENTKVMCLGTMGEWTYIEAKEKDVLFRGFVPTECLSGTVTTLREARQAMLGSWKLYVGGAMDASRIVFREDGTMTGAKYSGPVPGPSTTTTARAAATGMSPSLSSHWPAAMLWSSTACASAGRLARTVSTSTRWFSRKAQRPAA